MNSNNNTNVSAAHGSRPSLGPPRLQERSHSSSSYRSTSSQSSTNDTMSGHAHKPSFPQGTPAPPRPATSAGQPASASTVSLQNFSRPGPPRTSIDSGRGSTSSIATITSSNFGHRPRQHSQGFFEPSLGHASSTSLASTFSNSSNLSASQIAAQAAMSNITHERKRSVPGLFPINTAATNGRRMPSPTLQSSPTLSSAGPKLQSTTSATMAAAASAANAAFPRSPLIQPSPRSGDGSTSSASATIPLPPQSISGPLLVPEKEIQKARSKMKLFSKPKNITLSKDKDQLSKNPPLPSPVRSIMRPSFATTSSTSLLETVSSSAGSIYSASNASTSTLVPVTATTQMMEREKEREGSTKHRPHFLSRQKHKQIEKNLQLSSASSNSQAVDPSAPHSLYSFAAPQSPGAQSTFAKSMSGLDLRHGGRALREKKKEEKAAANMGLTQTVLSNGSTNNLSDYHRGDLLGSGGVAAESIFGPASGTSNSMYFDERSSSISAAAFTSLGSTMGLTGITPDDAWPLLKARLLNIFEGEDLRTPIEDFNLLVSVHVRRCIQKRAPTVLLEDLRELLVTGFTSLSQTLRSLPEDKLVPRLVELWLMVYCTILPFIQAVFLPLDLEFRGHGPVMSSREAENFWGSTNSDSADILDVRRTTLIAFRDTVILPRHETLLHMFSRLSLYSLNSGPLPVDQYTAATRVRGASNAGLFGHDKTSFDGGLSPHLGSYNSQTSTLLDAASSSSGGALSTTMSRSRATSNTSAGSFAASMTNVPSPIQERRSELRGNTPTPPLPPSSSHGRTSSQIVLADPAKVMETVARMLQCVSVVAAVQTGDAGQMSVDKLTVALKHNWLGRGRTGRQRRGWVGMRVGGSTSTDQALDLGIKT